MTATETKSKADARVSLRWIPKDSRKIEHALGVCYVQDELPRGARSVFTVMGYIGTAGKSAMYESYRTAELRDKRVSEFFTGLVARASELTARAEYDERIGCRPGITKTIPIEPTKHKASGSNYVHFEHGCGSPWDGRPKYESWYA